MKTREGADTSTEPVDAAPPREKLVQALMMAREEIVALKAEVEKLCAPASASMSSCSKEPETQSR